MCISKLFDSIDKSDENLWLSFNNIIKHSVVFQSFYNEDDDKDSNDIKLEIAFSLKEIGFVDFNLLYKVFINDFQSITEYEIIDIIKNLNYLDSSYLVDILTIMKYKYSNLKVPYDDLEYMYNNIIIVKDEINTYIINNCINIICNIINIVIDDNYLYMACKYDNLEIVKFLIDNGATIYVESLLMTIKYGNLKVLKYIAEKNDCVYYSYCINGKILIPNLLKNLLNNGALVYASEGGQYSTLKYLISYANDNDLNINYYYEEALLNAAENGYLKIVEYLAEVNGTDINSMDNYALLYACYNGHISDVKYLVEQGANIHKENGEPLYDSPLYCAISMGHLEIVKFFVEHLPYGESFTHNKALYFATKNNCQEMIKYLESTMFSSWWI